jgi:gluconolactonase
VSPRLKRAAERVRATHLKGEHVMDSGNGISRRRMLATSAAGGLALGSGGVTAWAQAAKRIDPFEPEFDKIISASEPILELATGFGGGGNTEGPVWWKEGGYLLFSSIGENRRIKYTPGQGTTVAKEKTNGANGLTRDPQGRLVACEGLTRRVTREEADGSITVIANSFQGHPLNKPNDVVVKSDGAIYFTDPWNIAPLPQQWDLSYNGVFRVSPDLGTISLLVDTFALPNGLAFSPDEKVLYINDSRRRQIRAFDMLPNGLLARQTERVFVELAGTEPGGPDGMKVDIAGNVYCGGPGGIYVMDPQGRKLGRIVHGNPQTTNIAFGGDDWKTLYFTSRTALGSVRVKIPGVPVPATKRG